MCRSCEVHVDGVWLHLAVGQSYRTPDENAGVAFEISKVSAREIAISPQNILISRQAFSAALHYLCNNRHDAAHPCEIRSNNNPNLAGPLCREARSYNNNIRCINYIVPILAELEIVGIGSARPNTTWVVRCSP